MKIELRKLRIQRNITQQELADKVGVSQYYISKIENGNCNPTVNLLSDIAKELDCCTCELVKCKKHCKCNNLGEE